MLARKVLGLRETLVAVALSLALVCACFPQVVFAGASILSTDAIFAVEPWASEAQAPPGRHPYNGDLGDHDFQFFPLLVEIQRQLHAGEAATWTPHAYAGAPLLANVQLARYDLFHLALPFFQDRDAPFSIAAVARGLSVTGLLRLALCLFFAYAWLRRLGGSVLSALLAAVFIGLGPYASVWRLHTPEQVFAWWPLALFLLETFLQRGSFLAWGGFAFALTASQLGGYPQTSIFFGLFCLGYAVLRAPSGGAKVAVQSVVAAGAVALFLCAPVFVPWFVYALESGFQLQREGQPLVPRHSGFGSGSLVAHVLCGAAATALLVAAIFLRMPALLRGACFAVAASVAWVAGADGQGALLLFGEARGHPLHGHVDPVPAGKAFTEMVQDHIGALLLWILGAFGSRRALFALVAVLALASGWPFVSQGLRFVLPWLEVSRAASLVPLLVGCMLVTALRQASHVGAEARAARLVDAARGLVGAVLVFSTLALAAALLRDSPAAAWIVEPFALRLPYASSLVVLGLVCAVASNPAWLRPVLRALRLPHLLAGCGVLLACNLTRDFQPVLEQGAIYPRTATIDFLAAAQRADPDARVFAVAGDGFRGNALQTYGISDVFALDGMEPRRFMEWLLYLDYPDALKPRGSFRASELAMLGTQVFDLVGARYVVATKGDRLPDHFAVVHEGPRLVVAENPRAAPRAWLTATRYDLDASPMSILARAVTEHVGLPVQVAELEGARMQRGRVTVTERGSDVLEVAVEVDGAAWLVVRDLAHPGWEATKRTKQNDGGEAASELVPIEVGFAGYRVVRVDASTEAVRFAYRPVASPRLGLAASLVAMILAFAMLLLFFFRVALWPFAAIDDVKKAYHAGRSSS